MANIPGTSGNDSLTGTSSDDFINGSGGDDTLVGGGGDDSLSGEAGNDRLAGGTGYDTMTGGTGNDIFVLERQNSYAATDIVSDFAQGQDRIDVSGLGINSLSALQALTSARQATDGSQVTRLLTNYNGYSNILDFGVNQSLLTSADFIFATNTNAQTLTGTNDHDDLFGGSGSDTLAGGGGNDRLFGDGGDDRLIGGTGNDTLYGGAGNDLFVLERQSTFYADDTVADFTQGQDRIDVSGLGIVSLSTLMTLTSAQQATDGSQITRLDTNYNGYDNILYVGVNRSLLTSADFVFATNVNAQSLTGTSDHDDLFGGSGNDTLAGGGGNDRLLGDAGNDRLIGGTGNDTLYGGAGNDLFVLERQSTFYADDTVADFTQGQDRIDVSGLGIVSLSTLLTLTSAQQASDGSQLTRLETNYSGYDNILYFGVNRSLLTSADFVFATNVNAQSLTGTSDHDDLFGGTGNDTLGGGGGNDRLFGDGGDDRLVGGTGNDTLYGGAGNDLFVLERQNTFYADDTVADFTQGQDRIDVSGLGINSLSTLLALTSAQQAADGSQITRLDTNYNGYDNILYFGVNRSLLTAADFIFANNITAQTLTGTSDHDDLFGGSGNDTLGGGTGNDRLFGDSGDDRLIGGAGSDILYGGAGNDIFVLERQNYYYHTDTIADFTQGQDRIDVSGLGITSLSTVLSLINTQPTGDGSQLSVLYTAHNGYENRLAFAVNKGQLTAADFIFATQSAAISLTGSSSEDDLFGGSGNDTLAGASSHDRLFGDAGDDRLTGGAGNDTLVGGLGQDTAVFTGIRANYLISTVNGQTVVTDQSRTDGTDVLVGVETLAFSDQNVTLDVPSLPVLTFSGGTVREGQSGTSSLVFTVSLSSATTEAVSFTVTPGTGTATAGVDFAAMTGVGGTIAAGSRTATITLSVKGDTGVEGHETVVLNLGQVSGATLAGNATSISATGRILNDDFQSSFSLDSYKALNPDLVKVFGNDDAAYIRHYITNGRAEGRLSSGFDADAYAALNPDLFRAFGLNADALASHYLNNGRYEGRAAEGFDVTAYIALNPDLQAVFGSNATALVSHYITNGRAEGRLADGFDVEAYAALNPDLFRAFGLNSTLLLDHYIHHGKAEGRAAVGFDAETYAALNPDLLNVFGLNHSALISHYISNGRAEGRLAFDAGGIVATSPLDLIGVTGGTAAPALSDLG